MITQPIFLHNILNKFSLIFLTHFRHFVELFSRQNVFNFLRIPLCAFCFFAASFTYVSSNIIEYQQQYYWHWKRNTFLHHPSILAPDATWYCIKGANRRSVVNQIFNMLLCYIHPHFRLSLLVSSISFCFML